MGSRSVNLFERMSEKDKPKLPSDTKTFDYLIPNVRLTSLVVLTTTHFLQLLFVSLLKDSYYFIIGNST